MANANSKPNLQQPDRAVPTAFGRFQMIPDHLTPIDNDENRLACDWCDQILENDVGTIKKHRSTCSSAGGKSSKNVIPSEYLCHACKTGTLNANDFKSHIMTKAHEKRCRETPQYSFFGASNSLMIYAPADVIKKRMQCEGIRHCNSVPVLSKFMKVVLDDFEARREVANKWYACIPCNMYGKIPVHPKKSCYNCKTKYYCRSCRIEIICKQSVYNNHVHGYEHMMITIKRRTTTGRQDDGADGAKTSADWRALKLPQIILNRFEFAEVARCTACDKQCDVNEAAILAHLKYACRLRMHVLCNENPTDTKRFKCSVCKFENRLLVTWKFHVLSPSHLARCHQKDMIFSNFCDTCSTYFYGDADPSCKALGNHRKISPLSEFMADVYHERNRNANGETFRFTEPSSCRADVGGGDATTKLLLQHCPTCDVTFFSSRETYDKHAVTAEHLVLTFGRLPNRSESGPDESPAAETETVSDRGDDPAQSKGDPVRSEEDNFRGYFRREIQRLAVGDRTAPRRESYSYCCTCDYVADDRSLWDAHEARTHSKCLVERPERKTVYCESCRVHVFGLPVDLERHRATYEHSVLYYLRVLAGIGSTDGDDGRAENLEIVDHLRKMMVNLGNDLAETNQTSPHTTKTMIDGDDPGSLLAANTTTDVDDLANRYVADGGQRLPWNDDDDYVDRVSDNLLFSVGNRGARSHSSRDTVAFGGGCTDPFSEDDHYSLYVGHRLKQIKDDSVKLKIKLAIDDIFCKSMKYSDP